MGEQNQSTLSACKRFEGVLQCQLDSPLDSVDTEQQNVIYVTGESEKNSDVAMNIHVSVPCLPGFPVRDGKGYTYLSS
jgi:hypothetical protein